MTITNTRKAPVKVNKTERDDMCERAMKLVAKWFATLDKEQQLAYRNMPMPMSYMRQGTTYLIRTDANHAQWVEVAS